MSTPSTSTVPVATRSPQPLRGLAVAASTLIGVAAVVRAVTITIESQVRVTAMAGAVGGTGTGYADSIRSIKSAMLGVGGGLLVYLVAGIVFMTWLSRARTNAALLSPGPFRLGAGWAVGAWFVPLANLVMPAIVVGDTWRASSREARPAGPVAAWWLALCTTWVLDWAANITRVSGGDPLSAYRSSSFLLILEAIATLVAGALAVLVIRRITDSQEPRVA